MHQYHQYQTIKMWNFTEQRKITIQILEVIQNQDQTWSYRCRGIRKTETYNGEILFTISETEMVQKQAEIVTQTCGLKFQMIHHFKE